MSSGTVKQIKIKASRETLLFRVLGGVLVTAAALCCLIPFIILISGSFTSEHSIAVDGYSIFPKEFSLEAYRILFGNPVTILRGYGVSILITVSGTAAGLFIVAMTAYVLSRRDFKYRNKISFFFYFTTLFNGGLVSSYIFYIRCLHLKNSYLALIFPLLFNVFYLLIMRSFMSSIPSSIIESARMDGAGEFGLFLRIILPLARPGLVTVGMFIALDYWNDWYNAMLYISDHKKYPLQYMLYNLLFQSEAMKRLSSCTSILLKELPSQSLKLAMAVIAAGPAILIYPFMQSYFIKGITIGAVKG